MKQNEEAKTQRNVAQYFKKYEDTFGPSEDLQNKEFGPQLTLPLQAELYWRSLEVLKADRFSGLLEYLAKTSRSASRSLIISRNDLSILHLFPSFPFNFLMAVFIILCIYSIWNLFFISKSEDCFLPDGLPVVPAPFIK